MQRYFVIGTDTDCGKTYVTRQLINQTPDSAGIKPLASGCLKHDDQLISEDAVILQKGSELTLDQINPWRFALPVSPHIAAEKEGKYVSAQELSDYCLEFTAPGIKTLFIEGAGGLLVPINPEETWIDFLRLSKIPVILVVGMKLGCINHALLTAEVLALNAIECAGWIANCLDPEMLCLEDNIRTLSKKLSMPLLSTDPNTAHSASK